MSLATFGMVKPHLTRNSIRFRMSMVMCFLVSVLYGLTAASGARASESAVADGIEYMISSGFSKNKHASLPRGGSVDLVILINNSQSLRRVNERQTCIYFWKWRVQNVAGVGQISTAAHN